MNFAKEVRKQQDREKMYLWKRAAFWLGNDWGWTPTVIDYWNTTSPVIAQYGTIGEWDHFIGYHSMNQRGRGIEGIGAMWGICCTVEGERPGPRLHLRTDMEWIYAWICFLILAWIFWDNHNDE